jgi:hypothetical protein
MKHVQTRSLKSETKLHLHTIPYTRSSTRGDRAARDLLPVSCDMADLTQHVSHQPAPSIASSSSDPLSSARPRTSRRASSFTNLPTTSHSGYFDIPKASTQRQHAASVSSSRPAGRAAHGLAPGPPPRFRGSARASPAFSEHAVMEDTESVFLSSHDAQLRAPSTRPPTVRHDSGRPWTAYLDSLSKEEMQVVEMRFDLMADDELDAYMRGMGSGGGLSQGLDLLTPRGTRSREPTVSPTTPMPMRLPVAPIMTTTVDEPLFPPSPPLPPDQRDAQDHPLRILSRAVRELKEAIEQLEAENERLRSGSSGSKEQTSRHRLKTSVDQVSAINEKS